jgi:hypothetical protein
MPINAIKEAATTAIDTGKKIVVNTSTAITNGINKVVDGFNSVITNAQNGLSNAGADILSGAVGIAANRAQNSLNDFVGPIAQLSSSTPKVNISNKPPFRNILHNYASYNYIMTLFVVDKDSFNFASYRRGYEGSILLKSGSGSPENRVQTQYGKYDFYIDDFELKSTVGGSIAVGNAEGVEASFKVIEPYSMGLFMQSLEIAAAENGYDNYLEAPLILKIEFKGHLNDTQQGISADELSIERTTKYFALRQSEISMKVTGKGAEYNFTTTALNLVAMTTMYSELKTDVSIEGSTVHELLQTGDRSLQKVLNDKLKEVAKIAQVEPDQIIIHFPSDLSFPKSEIETSKNDSATVNPNSISSSSSKSVEEALAVSIGKNETLVQQESSINVIGQSSMGFDFIRPADQPFAKDKDAYNSDTQTVDRSKINIKPNIGVLRFQQGTNIQHIINQVVLTSNYCKNALKPEQITEDGKLPYWKIDTQVFYLDSSVNISKKGVHPKLIVYRVVPFMKDASKLLPPNTANPWTEAMSRTVLKEYDYIYTGKNLDVLNFNVQYNAGFYKSMNADLSRNSDSTLTQRQNSNVAEDNYSVNTAPPSGSKPTTDNPPTSVSYDNIKTSTNNRGGTSIDTPATLAARSMHDILYHSPELNQLDLTILGDPFYLGDSGIGNYFARASNYSEMNADYSMNNQYGDVRISITFRTPLDLDPSIGAYTFGPNRMVNRFSGIYTVQQVTSKFSKGKFTQQLTGVRVEGQTLFNGQLYGTAGLAKLVVPTESETIADIFNTAIRYGTTAGSEQTRLLAEQDAGFFDD